MTAETLRRRVAALGAMDFLARNFNDERLAELWLTFGVPDGADDDDYASIAEDDQAFKDCASAFGGLVRTERFARSGFCFD